MTYYADYKDLRLTCYERPDGAWAVRCKKGVLHVAINDTILLTDKRGNDQFILKVQAFNPHYQSGKFSRSGHIIGEAERC